MTIKIVSLTNLYFSLKSIALKKKKIANRYNKSDKHIIKAPTDFMRRG